METKLSKYAPPGYDFKFDRTFFSAGIGIATGFSFSYLLRFMQEKNSLYEYHLGEKILRPDAIMPDFIDIFRGSLWGYLVLAICMLILIGLRYAYYYQNSKSIYLMKRLPSRFEMHRRCIIVPVIAALLCAAAAFLVLLLYFGHYMLFTPDACLTPGQWAKIWR